ncbi:hypothetical protein [Microbaculum marinum]|uniref:Uncharacterized protein n=1 Tax=Microbaculum marinum TaxID=1764581 RepID=A0AAW9S120_9HYPH
MTDNTVSHRGGGAGRSLALFRRRKAPIDPSLPPVRIRQVRRGLVASFVAPIGGALAITILAIAAASLGTTWWTSFQRDGVFSQMVKPDGSIARIAGGAGLTDDVTILVRGPDGELTRRVAERSAADRHVNEALARLDGERARAKALASEEIDQVFKMAFVDRQRAIDDYADWFFAWRRPYVVLKEAVVSTLAHIAETGEYEPLATAIERDLQTYFMDHYAEHVLKPGQRDPLISAGFEDVARRAHERWRQAVVAEDLRLQLFLAEQTREMDDLPADQPLTDVALDWDSQRFRAPLHLTDDRSYDGLVSFAAVGAGGTIGALALGPVLDRVLVRAFSGFGRRYAASLAGRAAVAEAGAVAGTAVQPIGGTVIGAVAGGALGLAADYLINEAGEAVGRDDFVAANQEAVDSTIETWKGSLENSVHGAIDRWFDDSRAALVSGS